MLRKKGLTIQLGGHRSFVGQKLDTGTSWLQSSELFTGQMGTLGVLDFLCCETGPSRSVSSACMEKRQSWGEWGQQAFFNGRAGHLGFGWSLLAAKQETSRTTALWRTYSNTGAPSGLDLLGATLERFDASVMGGAHLLAAYASSASPAFCSCYWASLR
jgi:hypothetical protein